MMSFPFPFPEAQGDFYLQYLLWECDRAPGDKIHKSMVDPHDRVPLEFLTLGVVRIEPPTIH